MAPDRTPDRTDVAWHLADLAATQEGFALLDDARHDEARAVFERRLAEEPESAAARVGLVRAARAIDERAELIVRFQQERLEVGRSPRAAAGAIAAALERRSEDPVHGLTWAAAAELDSASPWAAMAAASHGRGSPYGEIVTRGGYSLSVRRLGADSAAGDARDLLGPWLGDHPGALLVWRFALDELGDGSAEVLAGAERAARATPEAPLAGGVLLACAKWIEDGERRLELLRDVEARGGPYADDAVVARASMFPTLLASGRRAAIAVLEPLVLRAPPGTGGDKWSDAARRLVDLYAHEARTDEALAVLGRLEARGARDDERAAALLLASGRLEEAEERCRAWLGSLEDARIEGFSDPRKRHAQWLLGDVLLAAGRPAEALALYDEVAHAPGPGVDGPWRHAGGRLRVLRAIAEAHGLASVAGASFLLLSLAAFAFGALAFVARIDHVRRFAPAAAGVALVVLALQVADALAGTRGLDLASGGYLLLAALRNFVLVAACGVLLPGVGVKHGPLVPLPRGRRRRAGHALAGLVLALGAMAAITSALYAIEQPRIGPLVERLLDSPVRTEMSVLVDPSSDRALATRIVAIAAVQEELVFRGVLLAVCVRGLRRRLPAAWSERAAKPAAVVACALAFGFAHAGLVEPEWIKLAQASALGGVLGVLVLRHGLAAAVLAHVVFNVAVVLLSP